MKESEFIDKIIDNLNGTCDTFEDHLEYYGIKRLDDEALKYFDENIFCCSNCGWWQESSHQDIDGNCIDCQEEE